MFLIKKFIDMIEKFNDQSKVINTICAFYEYSKKGIFNHYLKLMLDISLSLCYYCLTKENKKKLFNIMNKNSLDLQSISNISEQIMQNDDTANIIEEFIY